MCVCLCVCKCMYMYVYICVCMYMYMYICVYVCMYACIYVCMYIYMYIYICMYICMYVCMYVYIYIYIYLNLNPTTEKLTNCFRRKYLFHIMVKSLTRIPYRTMSSGDIYSNVKLWMTSCICCLGFLSFDSYILIWST